MKRTEKKTFLFCIHSIIHNSIFITPSASFVLVLQRKEHMTTSRRFADRKSEKFQKNITKRGSPSGTTKKGNEFPVGPVVIGFFVFVIVGSFLFQIIRTALSGGKA